MQESFHLFQILLQGREALNRAVDGDVVCVELLPEAEWKAPSEIVLEDKAEDPSDDSIKDEETEKLLSESVNQKEKQPTGKIVGIIKRKWRQYCGIIQPNILKGAARHIFIPAERKIPRVRIETRQAEKLYNQRVIVAIDQWPRHSRYPQGHFVRSLGPLGDKDTENEVLLIEHDVPHSKFSEEVLNCLPSLPWVITDQVSSFNYISSNSSSSSTSNQSACSVPGNSSCSSCWHKTSLESSNSSRLLSKCSVRALPPSVVVGCKWSSTSPCRLSLCNRFGPNTLL